MAVMISSDAFASCDQELGRVMFEKSQYVEAASILQDCDLYKAELETLSQLIFLYGVKGLGEFKTHKDRVIRLYQLYYFAALSNSDDAITVMVDVFTYGDPELPIKKDESLASCLRIALEMGQSRGQSEVRSCFDDWESPFPYMPPSNSLNLF